MDEIIALAVGVIAILIYIPFIIFYIICWWKIYTKADKAGWASLIPIYSTIVMLQIIGKPWWWIFLFIIPGVNIVFGIWAINLLSKSYGHGTGFTLGLIFLSFIFIPILGLSKDPYIGQAGNNFNKEK